MLKYNENHSVLHLTRRHMGSCASCCSDRSFQYPYGQLDDVPSNFINPEKVGTAYLLAFGNNLSLAYHFALFVDISGGSSNDVKKDELPKRMDGVLISCHTKPKSKGTLTQLAEPIMRYFDDVHFPFPREHIVDVHKFPERVDYPDARSPQDWMLFLWMHCAQPAFVDMISGKSHDRLLDSAPPKRRSSKITNSSKQAVSSESINTGSGVGIGTGTGGALSDSHETSMESDHLLQAKNSKSIDARHRSQPLDFNNQDITIAIARRQFDGNVDLKYDSGDANLLWSPEVNSLVFLKILCKQLGVEWPENILVNPVYPKWPLDNLISAWMFD